MKGYLINYIVYISYKTIKICWLVKENMMRKFFLLLDVIKLKNYVEVSFPT